MVTAQNYSGSAYVIPRLGEYTGAGYSLDGQVFVSSEIAGQLATLVQAVLMGQAAGHGINASPNQYVDKVNFAAVFDFNSDADKTYRFLNVKGYAEAQNYPNKLAKDPTSKLSVLYEPDINGLVSFRISRNLASYKDGTLLNKMSPVV